MRMLKDSLSDILCFIHPPFIVVSRPPPSTEDRVSSIRKTTTYALHFEGGRSGQDSCVHNTRDIQFFDE